MTNVIHLRDNNYEGQEIKKVQVLKDICELAKINLEEPPQDLLIFPQSFTNIKDKSNELPIFTLRDIETDETKKANLKSVKVCTGNIMGFVGKGDTSVSIHSRFTHSKSNNGYSEDYFLYYMLQKVFNINLYNLDHAFNRNDKIMDFLLFLFPDALKNALAQGIYKEYQQRDFDDSRVRGAILVNQVIRKDIPFQGRISYRTRQHSYDNPMTQLVRHTIEYIKNHPFGAAVLNNNSATKEYITQIVMATPSYNPRNREKMLKANLRPKVHPYFLGYRNLQRLCVSILRHDSLKYGKEKDKVHGILFDGAWLWEEYLNTILKDLGFTHPRNKESIGKVKMFINDENSQNMYPDFYKPVPENNNRASIILDAKYKYLDKGPVREDLYQVISYMYCMAAPVGGFIYPYNPDQNPNDSPQKTKSYELAGIGEYYKDKKGGIMKIIPFTVLCKNKWDEFLNGIVESEKKLKEILNPPIRD